MAKESLYPPSDNYITDEPTGRYVIFVNNLVGANIYFDIECFELIAIIN